VKLRPGGAEILLVLGSLLFLGLLALIGELAVRTFSDLNFLGNSRDLFVAEAYGPSKGNAPNAEGVSFGAVVYTDEHGFRVPKGGFPGDDGKTEAILILGDSVGFGPAVEEGETFAGLLRARFPTRRIYNSSVIGYATDDYKNIVDSFLPLHEEVVAVVLVYCLNDVSTRSAQNIDRYLQAQKEERIPEEELTESLRAISLFRDANDFLRERSKFYLWLKHRVLRSQRRGWKAVLPLYADDGLLAQSIGQIGEIAAGLKERGIPFVVALSPFEYQLRHPDEPESEIPQRKVGALLAAMDVDFIDPRPRFDGGVPPSTYFLPYDPMHLSREGHRVMTDVIVGALRD